MKNKQFDQLISKNLMEKIQNNFCKTLEISLALHDANGNNITQESNSSIFWKQYVFGNPQIYPKSKAAEINAIRACIKTNETHIFNNYLDIYSFAVPVIINSKLIAIAIGGKIRTNNPNMKVCKNEADSINADFDQFLEAYLSIPMITEDQLYSAATLIKNVLESIIEMNMSKKSTRDKIDEMKIMNDMLQKEVYSRTKTLYETSQKYKSIIENAIDIITSVNRDGIFVDANSAVEEILEYSKDEFIGSHFTRFIVPEDIDKFQEMIDKMISGKLDKVSNILFEMICNSGKTKYFSISANILKEQDNSNELQLIFHDITESKRLENELNETKDQYINLLNSVKDGVYFADMGGNFCRINDGMCRLFGYNEYEFLKMNIDEIYVNKKEVDSFLNEIKTEESGTFITTARHKNGHEFTVEYTGTLQKDEKGEMIGRNVVIRDITSRIKYINKAKLEEMKFKALFENLDEGIIITDEKGMIKEYNKKALHIFRKNIHENILITNIIPDITPQKIDHLRKKDHVAINYLDKLHMTKSHPLIFSVMGIKVTIENEIVYQWVLKETCRIDYVPENKSLMKLPTEALAKINHE